MTNYTPHDTYNKVSAIVAEKLSIDPSTIKPNSTMQELGADSLDLVEIIMKLEESFGLEIADADIVHLNSMQEFVDYIHQRRTK